jgi:hypothetical protein
MDAGADALARQDISATLMWLRHGGVGRDERVRMGAAIMHGSVLTQAAIQGLVDCPLCADAGCSVCAPAWQRP